MAKLSKTYYPQLDISLEVGFAQRLRWFVSPKAIGLADALDKWAKDIPEDQGFHEIYKRYFELSKSDDGEESPLSNTPDKGGYTFAWDSASSPITSLYHREAAQGNHYT